MRSLLNSALRGFVSGLALCVAVGLVSFSYANISLFGGPTQSGVTVANQPNMISDLNSLVNNANTAWGVLNFGVANETGEMTLLNGTGTWIGHTNCTTAAAECIVTVDETGRVGYIPVY